VDRDTLRQAVAQAKKDGKTAADVHSSVTGLGHDVPLDDVESVFDEPELKVVKVKKAKKAKK